MDKVTTERVKRRLVTIGVATHKGARLAPVDAALVVRAHVAVTTGQTLNAVALGRLQRIADECAVHVQVTIAGGEAA